MFRTILLCSDGSEHAIRAASAAADLTKATGARLITLHVFEMPTIAYADGGIGLDPALFEPPGKEAQDAVVGKTSQILAEAGVAFEDRRRIGLPAEEILRAAEDLKADVVVLGSRGLGGFQRLLLGSVSDQVAHHAHCAVLIIK